MNQKSIRIVLVDDHVLVRRCFVQVLCEFEHYKIVAEASNGKELLTLLPELSVDIILLDVEMPIMNGYETMKHLSKQHPDVKVIILSGHYNKLHAREFINLGARAYLPKSCDMYVLFDALENVRSQGYYISDDILDTMESRNLANIESKGFEQIALTDKEVGVLKLICDGFSSKQMAAKLQVDINTIHYHKKNIFRKTNIKSIGPLVKYAIFNGYTNFP